MKIDISCPVCDHKGEDGGHLFFKCHLAKRLWRLLNLEAERNVLANITDATSAVEWVLQQKDPQKEQMVIILWFIWTERNMIREEGRRRSAEAIARCIEFYAFENANLHAKVVASGGCLPGRVTRERWTKPPDGTLKLNCDGSFLQNVKTDSWRFLIRDCDGDVVIPGRGSIGNLLNAFQAELIACLQGMQEAVNLGISRLIPETDAQEVVRALAS
jgi:hypothetical protein